MARTRVDLPDALCPMMPMPSPAFAWKDASRTKGVRDAGGPSVRFSTESWRAGRGRSSTVAGAGMAWRTPARRVQLARAERNERHWLIASSTGASARALRIELAMMMPPVACPLMTR